VLFRSRMPGDDAEYDVFISYRIASDRQHAELLHELLTNRGLKVWWNEKYQQEDSPWDDDVCHALLESSAFIPILSRGAINHPLNPNQSFVMLNADSACDNLFLEFRLALELREMGMIEKIFPVMIGDLNAAADAYTHYFASGCHPGNASREVVASVEAALRVHLDNQGLGSPYSVSETPHSVLEQITQSPGGFLTGSITVSLPAIVNAIVDMLQQSEEEENGEKELVISVGSTPPSSIGVGSTIAALKSQIELLQFENEKLKLEADKQRQQSSALMKRLKAENVKLEESLTSTELALPSRAFLELLDKFDKGVNISPR